MVQCVSNRTHPTRLRASPANNSSVDIRDGSSISGYSKPKQSLFYIG
jgi:hypothetical protein